MTGFLTGSCSENDSLWLGMANFGKPIFDTFIVGKQAIIDFFE